MLLPAATSPGDALVEQKAGTTEQIAASIVAATGGAGRAVTAGKGTEGGEIEKGWGERHASNVEMAR